MHAIVLVLVHLAYAAPQVHAKRVDMNCHDMVIDGFGFSGVAMHGGWWVVRDHESELCQLTTSLIVVSIHGSQHSTTQPTPHRRQISFLLTGRCFHDFDA